MTGRSEFLYERFLKKFSFGPTECQDRLFREGAEFVTCDDADILVVNGYAGTGKTSAMGAVIAALRDFGTPSVLLAPTGRAAKVLSGISKRPAYTIHKHIYRQKSVGDDGYGRFSLAPNKSKNTLFVVDEVSLIGLDMSQGQQGALFGTGNLLEDLVEFVRSGVGCRLIMMGDSAQLPPVGMDASPALSRSFMDGFGGVRYCELVSVVRQEKESGILRNATMLRELISSGAADSGLDSLSLDLRGVEDIARVSGGELVETLSDAYSRYGEDGTMVLCRSNKRAIRYNMGIRSMVQFKEEGLVRDDKGFEERYGLHFADARLYFPDYDAEVNAKVCLDTLESESATLSYEQQNALYQGVSADYSDRRSKKRIWEAVREDKYFNALQLKYADAITCHKSQGGQWDCVFVDCPFWQDQFSSDDLKWLYTAITRAVKQVYLVNFKESYFV